MSIHASLSSTDPGDLRTGGDVFLDWWFENNSPFPTETEFETHVYVDDIFVSRWSSTQPPPFQTFGISDWDDLNNRVRLDRGDHVFKLIVDALNQVNETDETDNIFERTYTWAGESLVTPTPGSRSINLALEPTSERNESVVVAAVAESPNSGPLTVNAPTFITWGVANNGLASTDDTISVHVSLDGVLVDRRIIGGLSALSRSALTDWAELGDLVNITPGEHTLEVAIDPGNLIDESDETDNTFTAILTWDTGPAIPPDAPPEPTPASMPHYEELLQANLVTTLPFDWDASLVIRSATSDASQTGRNGHVSAFTAGIVDYAIKNSSPVSTLVDFSTRVLLDNTVIEDSRFAAGSSGSRWLVDVAIPANRLTPGTHTLRLEIDSGSEVNEFDETDNSLTYEFEVVSGPALPVIPTIYTDVELAEMLAVVPDLLLETSDSDTGSESGTDWIATVLTVADAAYFLATGSALQDERIEISLLSRVEYELQNLSTCLRSQNSLTRSEYDTTLEDCQTTIGSSAGLTWPGTGMVKVRVDASSTPARTLSKLLHELGHARKTLLTPASFSIPSDARSAIGEAQAQVFEAVGMRHIEEFLGESFTRYPDLSVLQDDVSDLMDYHVERAVDLEEHSLGYELMWLAALQDVGGLGMADELRTTGVLSPASALAFYNYLVNISDQEAVAWVNARLAGSPDLIEEFREITLARLVDGLSSESEGHPHLLDMAFMAP
jgi:hypothetical protein